MSKTNSFLSCVPSSEGRGLTWASVPAPTKASGNLVDQLTTRKEFFYALSGINNIFCYQEIEKGVSFIDFCALLPGT